MHRRDINDRRHRPACGLFLIVFHSISSVFRYRIHAAVARSRVQTCVYTLWIVVVSTWNENQREFSGTSNELL